MPGALAMLRFSNATLGSTKRRRSRRQGLRNQKRPIVDSYEGNVRGQSTGANLIEMIVPTAPLVDSVQMVAAPTLLLTPPGEAD
jgi:hypothetical protein